LQHTPSTQVPEAHWLLAVHAAGMASFGLHTPAEQ
jgi:hypothetical protein